MTLQLTQSFGLANVSLGVNEIESGIAIRKFIGSIFTRKEDTRILDAFENRALKVARLPPWLQNIDFTREVELYGQDFRRLMGAIVMQDVETHRLQGLATFPAFCAHFVED